MERKKNRQMEIQKGRKKLDYRTERYKDEYMKNSNIQNH